MRRVVLLAWSSLALCAPTIQEGYYHPVSSPSNCLPGKVFYTKTDDELILNIGSTFILSHLDKRSYEEVDKEKCKTTLENSFSKHEIRQKETRACPQSKSDTIERKIQFTENSLSLSITRKNKTLNCNYKKGQKKSD